jgi:hypothetical protein
MKLPRENVENAERLGNPARGGLFIETNRHPNYSFLFFGGAAGQTALCFQSRLASAAHRVFFRHAAPPKNKKKNVHGVADFYKQATPSGVTGRRSF